ncbi:MAG: response regulator [Bdellovibrionales bacterium]
MGTDQEFLKLQQQYLMELMEQINNLELFFLDYDKKADKTSIHKSLSLIHSMKGTSGSYLLNDFSSLCHRFEDLLVDERAMANSSVNEVLFQFVDLIRNYVKNFGTDLEPDIIQEFNALVHDKNVVEERKCLVLEFSKSLSTVYKQSLQKQGYSVALCRDAFEGLKRLVLEEFDLIVLSTSLNSFGGVELFNAFNEIASNKVERTNFIIVTSDGSKLDKLNGYPGEIIIKDNNLIENLDSLVAGIHENHSDSGDAKASIMFSERILGLKKIFFVDDSHAMINLAKHIFGSKLSKESVEYFSDPESALARLDLVKPDLVICDVNMEEMDGIDLKNSLDEKLGYSPIFLFLTAEKAVNRKSLLEKTGAQGIILKPFHHNNLVSEMNELVGDAA